MTRLFAAVALLALATAPAFACGGNTSATTETRARIVATQPDHDTATPPPASHKPS